MINIIKMSSVWLFVVPRAADSAAALEAAEAVAAVAAERQLVAALPAVGEDCCAVEDYADEARQELIRNRLK